MAASSVSTLLQTGANRVLEREAALDSDLVSENKSLSSEITRLRLRVLELERAADTDPLMPVYNRRAFMRELSSCLLYTSPSPRDQRGSRMPSSA